jgi:hypothetical protein
VSYWAEVIHKALAQGIIVSASNAQVEGVDLKSDGSPLVQ